MTNPSRGIERRTCHGQEPIHGSTPLGGSPTSFHIQRLKNTARPCKSNVQRRPLHFANLAPIFTLSGIANPTPSRPALSLVCVGQATWYTPRIWPQRKQHSTRSR